MAEIVMIPLSGVLSRAFSTRWLFTASAPPSTLASIGCGLATNIEAMIAMRAVQGFLGGAMIPTVFATGFALFPGPKQAFIAAILGMSGSLAPTIGPTLGGWITDTYSWHWLFFVNIIPGIIIACSIPLLGRVDSYAILLFCAISTFFGLGLLAVALASSSNMFSKRATAGGRWVDRAILHLTWISAGAGGLFIWRILRHPNPLVDFRAFKNRTFHHRHALHLRHGIWAFRLHLPAAALPGADRGIQCPASWTGRLQRGPRDGSLGTLDRQAFPEG